jgi:large subunit ribosomal protein L24
MINKLKIKRGDTVVVTNGKDKGKQGEVLACFPDKRKIVIAGVNVVSKNQKPRSGQDKGGIIQKEMPLEISNAKLICPTCKKATRVGYKVEGKEKVRFCKKCNAAIKNSKAKAKQAKAAEEKKETKKDKVMV